MKVDKAEVVSTVTIDWGYWVYSFENFNKMVHIPRQKLSCFSFNNYLITFESKNEFKFIPRVNIY